ncbi:MAG: hypothetical protein A2X01_09960 [Bacteroidetes bacterium GWF2_35_48]|nr:MAG: hypothetical protein A2X01_09960 [Bacteroidetes bacterium GWF2_35_48]OFZ01275.1 MAG: hypothetical protein A2491_13915 [Bacteroidetes bacterium RIFOXYC12_FULL_35_7]
MQTEASSLIISAQWGHFFVTPLVATDGSNRMAITRIGTNAHNANHKIGLRPFGLAIRAPTIPATTIKIIYLIIGFYTLKIIIFFVNHLLR